MMVGLVRLTWLRGVREAQHSVQFLEQSLGVTPRRKRCVMSEGKITLSATLKSSRPITSMRPTNAQSQAMLNIASLLMQQPSKYPYRKLLRTSTKIGAIKSAGSRLPTAISLILRSRRPMHTNITPPVIVIAST